MGFTPQEVNEMSVWQYLCAVEGYAKANTPKEDGKLGSREADELWEWMLEKGV